MYDVFSNGAWRPTLLVGGAFAGLIATTVCPATKVHANEGQDSPVVSLRGEELCDFTVAFRKIAATTQVTVLAEGRPFRDHLEPQEAPDIAKASSLDEIITKIATAFDYEVVKGNVSSARVQTGRTKTVYLLRKRYSKPGDLPSVTLGECKHSLDALALILDACRPSPPVGRNTDLVLSIYRSLTAEQLAAAQQGGIPIRQLDAGQQAELRRMATHIYTTATVHAVQDAQAVAVNANSVRLLPEGTPENKGFGYSLSVAGRSVFLPFPRGGSGTDTHQEEGGTGQSRPNRPQARPSDSSYTLGAVVSDLNLRVRQKNIGNKQFEIERALAPKSVSAFGVDFAQPDEIFRGLAVVYGLREKTGDSPEKRLLTFSVVPRVKEVTELPVAVRKALPDPLMRACHDGEQTTLREEIRDLQQRLRSTPSDTAALTAKLKADIEQRQTLFLRSDQIIASCVAALRREVDRVLPAPPESSGIGLDRLSEDAQGWFAITTMSDLLRQLGRELEPEIPPYIARFEDGYLVGRIYEKRGKMMVGLSFGVGNNRAARPIPTVGISDIPLPDQ